MNAHMILFRSMVGTPRRDEFAPKFRYAEDGIADLAGSRSRAAKDS